MKSAAHRKSNCVEGKEQQKMKQIIGDLTREKMKQKKTKENQSRGKYRRGTYKGKRFKDVFENISVTGREG